MANPKLPVDLWTIYNTVKSVIESVQKNNQVNPNEPTAPGSVFETILNKVEDVVGQFGKDVPIVNAEDELGADSGFLHDVKSTIKENNPNQAEEDQVKAEFKVRENEIKAQFDERMAQIKTEFKNKHEELKKEYKKKLNSIG